MITLPRHVYSPDSEASVSNDGKIPGFCEFLFLSSVIKFENEMSEVKTKITIAQLLFMQSQNSLSKKRSALFITISSQRIKLFTGHVIKENMCARKRKQANIFRENTIL